ncbi:hypothetical protein PENSPDRAFT_76038 [Peniophora sp. CONT]|nr:hypothetical protein PENSPDRAFT_76038 [Peniophora sp. CONT]
MHAFTSTTLVATPAFRETASLSGFDTFSLSSWGCPTETATIVPEQAHMTPTTTFLPEPDPDSGLLRNTERFVATHNWTSRIANAPVEPVPEQDDLDKQSSVNSAWSTHSAITISALNGHRASHWVAPHARGKAIARAFKAPPEVIPEEA